MLDLKLDIDMERHYGSRWSNSFYGVRYQVSDDSEISLLSTRKHSLIEAAQRAGLEYYWGNFSIDGGESYLIYIGKEIANLGYEGKSELELPDEEFERIKDEAKERLKSGGFSLTPAFFAQFEPDI